MLIKNFLLAALIFSVGAFGDSPPPAATKSKLFTGDGITSITSTGVSGALDVNVTNTSGGSLTDAQLRASPVPISGSFSATSTSNGNAGAVIPSQTTIVGGSDGTDLRSLKVSSTGVLAVDASATTQPVSLVSVPTHGVTGTFWQTTQPVSLATAPTTPVTGTFWQTTQPVSGTFWQATQPVSILSMPTTAVTGTFWQTTQPVSIASMPSTAVTGTFWQATQPVSGTVTANAGTGTMAVSLATAPTTPVTGTFWQATQPVSGTMTCNAGTGTLAVSLASAPTTAVTGTFWQTTQPISISSGSIANTSFAATQATASSLNMTDATGVLAQGSKAAGTAATNSVLVGQVYSSTVPVLTNGQQIAAQSDVNGNHLVISPDLYFTGQSAQTALVNNIIPATAGATATDALGYHSATIQIIAPAGTYTTGQIIFEGSNDNTNFQTIPVWSQLILTGTPIVAAITVATTTNLVYTFPIQVRYIRVRISTAISGASAQIQAFTKLSVAPWSPGIMQVAQATGANLNAVITTLPTLAAVTTVSTVSSVTALAAVNTVATTNGMTIGTQITAATPVVLSVKATAGRLHFISVGNPNSTAVYLKLFNAVATLGTTSAAMNFYIPGTSVLTIPISDQGLWFGTAINLAVTGGASLTDNTAITTGCEVNYSFL